LDGALRKMQRAGGRPGGPSTTLRRLPVAFQRIPHRAPVLRGRLHHGLFHLVLDQPLGQEAQLVGCRAESPPREFPIPLDFHVRDDDRQHCFVHVDSCDPIGHPHLHYGGSGERALIGLTQGHGLPQGDAHLFAQARTLRIIQYDGVSASIVEVDLAARAGAILATHRAIFIRFRELMVARENARPSALLPIWNDRPAIVTS